MAAMMHSPTAQIRPEDRAAYGLAGHAIVASRFGLRFGTLALVRPFALDLTRMPERAHLLAILYAGHAAEAALIGTHHGRLLADRSPHFTALHDALVARTGEIDARATHSARLRALDIVREPGNWTAIEAVAERLAVGETLGYLTARRIIRLAVTPIGCGIAAG